MAVPAARPGHADVSPREAHVRIEVIGEAWRLLQTNLHTWIVAMLITVACGLLVWGAEFVVQLVAAVVGHGAPAWKSALSVLSSLLFMIVRAAVAGVFMGGLYNMAIKQVKGEPIRPGDLFGATYAFKSVFRYFLVLDVVREVLVRIPASLLFVHHSVFFGSVASLIVGGLLTIVIPSVASIIVCALLMLAIPLMVDRRLSLVAAVIKSWTALAGDAWRAILFEVVTSILSVIGLLACFVGVFITGPWHFLCIALLYRDFFLMAPIANPDDTVPPAPGIPPPQPSAGRAA